MLNGMGWEMRLQYCDDGCGGGVLLCGKELEGSGIGGHLTRHRQAQANQKLTLVP
jgi:hypothetical protein